MQFLQDFWPVIVFFVTYKAADIYMATIALMIALPVQIAWQWFRQRSVNKMLLISGLLVLLFGTATLVFKDKTFIQWKPTIANWLFAAAFLISQFVGQKITIAERIMGEAIELPRNLWSQLNLMWVVYFTSLGGLNLLVAYNFDEATWVNFKLFGTLAFTVVMVVAQGIWISFKQPHTETQ
ncbi:MAG: septation protein A [Gammaproteobacteria bacterium]